MFAIPLYDDNHSGQAPVVTWALIAACVLAFLWQQTLPPGLAEQALYALGVVPAVLVGGAELPPELRLLPPWASVVTSLFLHGGWLHLAGNMLYLWIFGNNVEHAMGHGRFPVFYLVCGVAAALTQSLAAPAATVPMIGASGAIAGVLGAYALLYPRANVRVLLVIIIFVRVINVPALVVLGGWFIMQFISGATTAADQGGVASWAHVGGFIAGMALVPLFKSGATPLFGARRSKAFQVMPARAIRRGSVPSVPFDRRPRGPWA